MTSDRLTEPQVAAVAKLACGCGQPGGLAVLCGPRGAGKSTVLRELAAATAGRSVDLRPTAAWAAAGALPDIVLADDAHETDTATLARLLRRCRDRQPAASLVLAGEGRLFTLISRDAALETAVRLRVAVPAFTPAESRRLLEAALAAAAGGPVVVTDEAVRTAHELAGGAPTALVRLADLAGVLAAARPDRRLAAADIEAVHERLSLAAA
jgi:type II secretory pathway predicted ATPase ExeA